MEWDESRWNRDLHDFVRTLIAIRRASPALRAGSWRTLAADDHRSLCVFGRSCGSDHAILVLHSGRDRASVAIDLSTLDLPGAFACRDPLSGARLPTEGRAVRVEVSPLSGALLMVGPEAG
jgi:hypothetical protein